jgi:two-component system nitrate/nitrite response regulator NarL
MNVLIVDDHALFRVGLEMLLTQLVPQIKISQATSASEAKTRIASGEPFDLVLLDWHMPSLYGNEALQMLREDLKGGRIVVLSGDHSAEVVRTCIDNGASGFISKDSTTEQLTEALHAVTQGQIVLPQMAQFMFDAPAATLEASETPGHSPDIGSAYPELTPRQCDVLQLVARGLSNKLIARELSISGDTVKQHLSQIYQTLNVRGRTEAVYMISQRGIRIN